MKKAAISILLATLISGQAIATNPSSFVELAGVEIRNEPIAGVYNKYWYGYVADVREAEQELVSDLDRATDAEDKRDAWDEYRHELVDADKDYVKVMRKKGYRAGRVTLG